MNTRPISILATAICAWAGWGCQAGATTKANGGSPSAVVYGDAGLAACGDTRADPHNCGLCGHDCLGGACESGACVPLGAGALASGQNTPAGIAVDEASVYWVDRGSYLGTEGTHTGAQILKCPKSGCKNAPTVLATGSWNQVTNLIVQGGRAYWAASGRIFACATDGCGNAPEVLWSSDGTIGEIAVDDASVFFDQPDSQRVTSCSIEGCDGGGVELTTADAASLAPSGVLTDPTAIALYGETLFAVLSGSGFSAVAACERSACSSTLHTLTEGSGFAPLLAVDATNVYFASPTIRVLGGLPLPIDDVPQGDTVVSFVSKDGPRDVTGLFAVSSPSAIAADGVNVYVAEKGTGEAGVGGAGRIAKCAIAGCSSMSTTVQGYVNDPQGIALDDANIYWTDFGSGTNPSGGNDGRVMFRPK